MLTIGLTGGIGSGKSTVLEVWDSMGAYIIKADSLAKHLMVKNKELKQQIIETFGEDSYMPDGELNRDYLAREAFQKGRVDELNNLVHPKVHQASRREIEKAKHLGYNIVVKEAALLLKNGRPDYIDVIVLVKADREQRIKWVSKRDQLSKKEVRDRIKRQQLDREQEDMADYIILNRGSLKELRQQASELFRKIEREKL